MTGTPGKVPVSVSVTRRELQILIGGLYEAIFELGDEFDRRCRKKLDA